MTGKTTRRGFIGAMGAAVAATALPADAAPLRAGPGFKAAAEQLRAVYVAELTRFAETLRPRFEAGELRGFCSSDEGAAMNEVERLVGRHFGLEVTEDDRGLWGDDLVIHAVLAGSSFADETSDCWNHEGHHATYAAAWDVVFIARARGWYTPDLEDELLHPGHLSAGCVYCDSGRFA